MAEAEQLTVVGESAPSTANMPDYLLEPNAVLLDQCRWRHGQVPDYAKATTNFEKGKSIAHKAGSLEDMVSNLVKNWEKEVSYKTHTEDFRTIDVQNYRFSVNGGVKRNLSEMLMIGTYSALIGDQALYCSSKLTFADSHKAFKQSMPDGFSWEVTEVLSGPPKVAFKWRHWGKMTGPLTCPLQNGLRMVAQPTNEVVSMLGVGVCSLNDKYQIQDLEVYFDQTEPMNSMVKANRSPVGLPAKGKTPGGVDMEMKPITTPISPERVKAITRRENHSGCTNETGMVTSPFDRQPSSDSDEYDSVSSGKGILSGIWGLMGLKS